MYTRPVFRSLFALLLQVVLHRRRGAIGIAAERGKLCPDLNALTETEIEPVGMRSPVRRAVREDSATVPRRPGARRP